MNVTLIGMGSGQPENLTLQGLAALRQADLILGARRLLAVLPAGCTENRAAASSDKSTCTLFRLATEYCQKTHCQCKNLKSLHNDC